MKYAEIKTKVDNIIDETDDDEQIDIIVKLAINEAYSLLAPMDKRLTRAFVPIVNGVSTLPNNLLEVVSIKPKLSGSDRVEGNSILTDKKGVFEILYSYVRESLTADNDEPDLHETLQYAMVDYACYKYYMHRKKDNVAMLFFNNYQQTISKFGGYDTGRLYDSNETINYV